MRLKHVAEVLHNDVSVVISLEEPVSLVPEVLVHVLEAVLCHAPQIVVSFSHIDCNDW